ARHRDRDAGAGRRGRPGRAGRRGRRPHRPAARPRGGPGRRWPGHVPLAARGRVMTAVTLVTPLRSVVGAAATKLRTQWDLHTVGDLLEFLPRTYLDATRPTDFRTLTEGEHVVIVARVV